MTPQEARRQAVLKFGGVESAKENYRDRRGLPLVEHLFQDVRYALRTFRRNPIFTLAVVTTLALGIGVNVTMFSVVDALLFRMPEHVRAPEQLVRVSYTGRNGGSAKDFQGYQSIQENARTINLTVHLPETQDFGRGPDTQQVNVDYVDANYFTVLGTEIKIGRSFAHDEDMQDSAAAVAILSFQFAEKEFGFPQGALNRQVWIGERQYAVIGVAPKGFNGAYTTTLDVWLPFADSPTDAAGFSGGGNLRNRMALAEARLVGGVTLKAAGAEADAIYLHSGGDPQFAIRVTPLFPSRTTKLSQNARLSLWLSGVALVVLLVGCANVANLYLVRMTQRTHEMAIRLQLGATHGRLVRQSMVESLLLASLGGVAALAVMTWASSFVRGFLFRPGFFAGTILSQRVVETTAFLTILAGLLSTLIPSWHLSHTRALDNLRSSSVGLSRGSLRIRSSLIASQVALTLMLAIGASLFIRSMQNIRALDLGFDPDHALLATVDLRKAGLKPVEINNTYEKMMERAKTVPGVEAAGLSTMIPFAVARFSFVKFPAASSASKPQFGSLVETVTPGYTEAVGMKVVQGRSFKQSDGFGAPLVSVINESFAHEAWPNQNPVGKCFIFFTDGKDSPCYEVVGVVEDVHLISDMTNVRNEFLLSFEQSLDAESKESIHALTVRIPESSPSTNRALFEALESAVPGGQYVDLHPLSRALDPQTRTYRLGASMFSLFGTLALLLSAVGIYGVLAFLVRQRTHEIGIRMALGAMRQDILILIVWQGMKFVLLGLAIGIGAALGLSRLMTSMLFEVKPTDLKSYTLACGVLLFVALAACLLPSWRATHVDPSKSLRYD
jgi:predicted permease